MNIAVDRPPAATGLAHDLAAVRTALLDDARLDADQIVAEARRVADELSNQTAGDTEAEVERQRHRSELAAQAHADAVLARARNDGRSQVLHKQEDLRRQLVDRVRSATLEIRHDRRYLALLDQLEAIARTQLGDSAIVERDRDPDGGVIATAGTRRVDYTLRALADRTLEAMSDEVAVLWQ